MERVLVVCGAGASSTFLAHRMRAVANSRAECITVIPSSAAGIADVVARGDIVLLGHHLAPQLDSIEALARNADAAAVLLPEVGFDERGAALALDLVAEARRRHSDHETLTHHTEPENIHG